MMSHSAHDVTCVQDCFTLIVQSDAYKIISALALTKHKKQSDNSSAFSTTPSQRLYVGLSIRLLL